MLQAIAKRLGTVVILRFYFDITVSCGQSTSAPSSLSSINIEGGGWGFRSIKLSIAIFVQRCILRVNPNIFYCEQCRLHVSYMYADCFCKVAVTVLSS